MALQERTGNDYECAIKNINQECGDWINREPFIYEAEYEDGKDTNS